MHPPAKDRQPKVPQRKLGGAFGGGKTSPDRGANGERP